MLRGKSTLGDREKNSHQEIVSAAVRLFMRKGYNNTSVDEIAEAAGLTKGGLYYYIEKKEDLLTAIHDEFMDALFAKLNGVIKDDAEPRDNLFNWIRAQTEIVKDYKPHIKVFITEIDHYPRDTFEQMVEKRDLAQAMFNSILVAGIEAKQIREDIDPKIISFLVFGMINWMFVWYRQEGTLSIGEITENMNKLVLTGIMLPQALPQEVRQEVG